MGFISLPAGLICWHNTIIKGRKFLNGEQIEKRLPAMPTAFEKLN